MKRLLIVIFCLFMFLPLWGDVEDSFLGFSLEVVQPFYSFEISETIFAGINTRLKFTPALGGSLGIYYLRTTNFGYDFDDGTWFGPASLADVNANGNNWIFDMTEWVITLNGVLYFPMGNLQPYFVTGPAWIILMPSKAAQYYPEFDAYVDEHISTRDITLGYITRFGVEYFILDQFSVGFDYLFRVDQMSRFFTQLANDASGYINRKSHLTLTGTFWIN